MSRRADLEQHIRESYDLIEKYEVIRRETGRPEERKRAERIIAEQWDLIREHWAEYRSICQQLGRSPSDEIADIAIASNVQNSDSQTESATSPMPPIPSSSNPKYETTIGQAQAVAVGEYAHVEQHFYVAPTAPSSATSYEELLGYIRQANAELRSYPCKTAGIHIDRSEVKEIVTWTIEAALKERLGMLQDRPGGGKTVVMRDVLENLEARDIPVLAIKADWLSGIQTRYDLAHRLGLPATVEECAQTLASEGLFVVLLDQLDALSLALSRDQATLDVMLSTLAHLSDVENVRIVASCRTFELHNDPRLSAIEVNRRFRLQPLADAQVNQVLNAIGVDPARLLPEHRELIAIPLHLKVYAQVIGATVPQGPLESFRTLQDLYDALWQRRIMRSPPENPALADRRAAIHKLVDEMQAKRQLAVAVGVLDEHAEAARYLRREGFTRREGGNWLFAHQTLFDYCYARHFAAEGRQLNEEILSGPQGLFERSQMVQVLAYLRGTDKTSYRQELTSLLFSDELRVHLRLLLIDWFGSLPDPAIDELTIARRLMRDPKRRTRFLRSASANEGWFDLLETDVVPLLLRSDDDQIVESTVYYLGTLIQIRTSEVLNHLRPRLGKSETWDARVLFCLSILDHWQSDEALEMLCDLFKRGYTGDRGRPILYKLARANPVAGCQALRAYLDRRLSDLLAQKEALAHTGESDTEATHRISPTDRFTWDRELLGEYGIGQVMEAAAQTCPENLVQHILPWFIRTLHVLSPSDEVGNSYPLDYLFSVGWYSEHQREGARFARNLTEALSRLAKTAPDSFRVVAHELSEIESLAAQRILAQAYLSDPEMYADDIFDYITSDPRRLAIGEHIDGRPRYDSERLYGAAFRQVGAERRSILEQMILELRPDWEQRDLRSHGITQLGFFRTVPPELLSSKARDRLGELERKFPDFEQRPPLDGGAGFIGSPIDETAQRNMSDEAWLSAMRKYDDSGYEHRDFLKGGVHQLSRDLSKRVGEEPERFYLLTQRFEDDVSIHYINAVISGLAESDAPAEWVFDLVREFAPRLIGPTRRSVCWALEKCAEAGVPDDILDLLNDWALNDPDPTPKSWPTAAADSRSNSIDKLRQLGVNSNRGAALETVCRCAMKLVPPQTDRVWNLLESAADDPSTAVRACVVENLRWVLDKDSERAVTIFEWTLGGHPRLLQSSLVHRFIYLTYRDHFSRVRPFIEALLANADSDTRQAGARLSCLAAFRHPEAELLARQVVGPPLHRPNEGPMRYASVAIRRLQFYLWLHLSVSRQDIISSDAEMRRGAAQVYARNLEYEDLEDVCRERLLQLMKDPDQEVRSYVGNCFIHLGAEHLDRLRPFIEAFVASPALIDGAKHLVDYLVCLAVVSPDLALYVTERILDAAGREITDMRREASVLERDVVRLPLMIYTHISDPGRKSRAMDLFEEFLLLGSRSAYQALEEWDRR